MRSRWIRLAAVAVGIVLPVSAGVASASPTYRTATAGPFATQALCDAHRISRNDPPDTYTGASCYSNGLGSWFYTYRYMID